MPLVKLLEGGHVALSRFLRQRVICFLLRLGFGCGHVFVLGQATKALSLQRWRAENVTSPRLSKERQPFPSAFPQWAICEGFAVTLNACVMRRFERVVALPDPKDIEIPQPQQYFPANPDSSPVGAIE
jgi:predicted lipoprotein